jgi:hypothetical protein
MSHDFEWLLDFPKKGRLVVGGSEWGFEKHGAGLRFTRQNPEPQIVVDAHEYFGDPRIVDGWRLSQFLQSIGCDVDDKRAEVLLQQLYAKGGLTKFSPQRYCDHRASV